MMVMLTDADADAVDAAADDDDDDDVDDDDDLVFDRLFDLFFQDHYLLLDSYIPLICYGSKYNRFTKYSYSMVYSTF